ncbi:hypothetical protein F4820DRAFT_428730 [Hypoxylon rubiginosum]|uniref:Uncharacterized protein n=1 Tax=Hypoxylon rubiginosum TaxID=110542 RepID=A0ACB9YU46_9PEZI|nr:hypothetical protein F4820DRAFT_428730 [Hypoxylon rubiginosum]
MGDSMKEVVEKLDPVARRLIPPNIDLGTLVPLKTNLELRDNLSLGFAYITRAPNKVTNSVVEIARALTSDDTAKNLPHLRRCVKPGDLPPHLKTQFMNEGNGRQVHFGKSNWLYILLGPKDEIPYEELVSRLATIDDIRDDIFVGVIPVPLLAPTSQMLASMWSSQFWQTIYRRNNPLGPHPSTITRFENYVSKDASVWMSLAQQIAKKSQKAGLGEPVGAVIIKRTIPGKNAGGKTVMKPGMIESDSSSDYTRTGPNGCNLDVQGGRGEMDAIPSAETEYYGDAKQLDADGSNPEAQGDDASKQDISVKESTEIVAIAADARWHQQDGTSGPTGNPMAHAALRAISMVAQKLVRAEDRPKSEPQIMEYETFQDKPLLGDEQIVFDADHPSPDGYLCHELELYMTHEPCIMCAMAILHSRMGRIVFRHRMPLTGGMCAEDRGYDSCEASGLCENGNCGGGQGLGLFYRKELNWSLLGWEWESNDAEHMLVDAHLHA